MLRHTYNACSQCHADPSGGGLLTRYGRAQGEILMRTQYGENADGEPGRAADFLFGVVKLPEEGLLLGGGVRTAYMYAHASGNSDRRFILMQADLYGQVSINRFRANASIGWGHEGAYAAAITHGTRDNLVSRVHWVGVDLGENQEFLLRAGRMNLPYGIRSVEHTMWIRTTSKTDLNAAQQHGVALSYNSEAWRAEIMAIAGNYQLNPDAFRERGGVGYLEYLLAERMAVGVSSLATYAKRHLLTKQPIVRQAHGVFARYAPITPLVLLAEADLLVDTSESNTEWGTAAMAQADYELIQGLHLIPTFELRKHTQDVNPALGAWFSVDWFFAPHTDLRVDVIYQNLDYGSGRTDAIALLGQLHFYL